MGITKYRVITFNRVGVPGWIRECPQGSEFYTFFSIRTFPNNVFKHRTLIYKREVKTTVFVEVEFQVSRSSLETITTRQ